VRQDVGRVIRDSAKGVLARLNLKVTRLDAPFRDYRDYIPFEATLAEAQAAGLPVADYIEARYDQPGIARDTLRQMQSLGVFAQPIERVCEVGPGSGRYLRETLRLCSPSHYEIYETASRWEKWLLESYPNLLARQADGSTLCHTPSESIDLVHAHKVLPGQSFLTTCRYLTEMARVVRTGGKVVFDMVTEACMEPDLLEKWLLSGSGYQHYPNVMPLGYATALLARHGLACDGLFFESMKPGVTQYMVLTKTAAGPAGH
jgi:hypothetical protein